jgi:hypothetical protein
MLDKLQLEPLEKRRKTSRLTLLYKIIHNIVDVDQESYLQLSKELRTRNRHKFKLQVQNSTKDVFKYSYFIRTARDWNILPSNIATITSLEKFNEEIAKYVD